MWFDVLKKEKTIEEIVGAYLDLYEKIYKSNDIEQVKSLRRKMTELFSGIGWDKFEAVREALRKINYEQLSVEDFISAYVEMYEEGLRGVDILESKTLQDKTSMALMKLPVEKETEYSKKLSKNPRFLEAKKNYEDYEKNKKEEIANKRRQKIQQETNKRNQERMMALQRKRTSGNRRRGQRK